MQPGGMAPPEFADQTMTNRTKVMQPATPTPDLPLGQPLPQLPKVRRFKSCRVIFALMLRELESSDSRTSLGFLWAFIDPIATITLMSLVFGVISRVPPIGTNFPLFYMTGIVPFGIYTSISAKTSGALRFSRPLLNFPTVKPIDAIFARFLLHLFIEVMVFLTLTYVIIHFWNLNPHIQPLLVMQSILLAAILGLGLGCFNAVFFLLLPTYDNVWSILTRPLMLASGVIIPIASIPEPYATYLWWNPIAHPIEIMRAAFYPEVEVTHASVVYVLLISLGAFTIGMVTLQSMIRDALED
jgi:capsular polysaccharide transport system permease protein